MLVSMRLATSQPSLYLLPALRLCLRRMKRFLLYNSRYQWQAPVCIKGRGELDDAIRGRATMLQRHEQKSFAYLSPPSPSFLPLGRPLSVIWAPPLVRYNPWLD